MDALLLHCPSMAKRPCCSSPTESPLVLNPSPRAPKPDPLDRLLESFIGLSDLPSLSLDLSLDRLLESRPCDSDQDDMIDRVMRLGSALLEAGRRSARKRATFHNAVVWALPPDLTIKVFSMLDTQSVCYAAATCTFFHKCASDPLCYANIDLTAVVPRVNNVVVSTMIQRAGKVLQSIKLGLVPGPTASPGSSQSLVYTIRNSVDASGFSWNDKRSRQGKESSILTRSCLSSLSGDSDAPGALLRRLHLYNIERMDNAALSASLSACPSLLDLEIVGLHVELRQTLESVSKHCHLIGRLHFESSKTGRDDSLKVQTCTDLVNNCPHLIYLALRGFKLNDCKIRVLVKGFRELNYVDFSTSYSITGAFLKNLGGNGNQLEVLILRDCMHLKEVEVAKFLTAVIAGDFKLLRHLDISNREGLASEGDWYHRCYSTSVIPVKQLLDERPGFCLLAEFPDEGSFSEIEQMVVSEAYSDFSLPSQPSSHTSDGTLFMSSSESSYNSDQGSGNEDCREPGYIIYEESSDEVDFLAG
ncbi:F-box protein At4g02760-like isoform X2 [Actinidia eriantha]|uniref:F-box protein At4g02760-like isoform X2 n=1 Tax=Actinidia eriantha TaxID=165200 RepID=UPI00258C4E36|nr:F-box protein At4g02760-like isoform X2 [Actinidia eriantha]